MIIPCVAVLFLLLGAFIGFPCFTCFSVIISCVCIPITLLLFAIHYPIGTAVSDVCTYIDKATDVTSPDYVEFIASIYECDDESPIGLITSTLDNAVNHAVSLFCKNITDLCNMSEYPCDQDEDGRVTYEEAKSKNTTCPIIDCSRVPEICDESTINETMYNVMVYNYRLSCYRVKADCVGNCSSLELYAQRIGECGNINATDQCDDTTVNVAGNEVRREYPLLCGLADPGPITLDQCAERCAFNETLSTSKTLVRYRNAASKIMDLLFNSIRPFLRCTTIVKILYNVEDFTCVKVVNSLRPLTSGSIAVAVGLIVMVIIGTLGAKRFNRKYRFRFAPMVDNDDNGDDIEMDGYDDKTKPLQTTVVEYDVSEDGSVIEEVEEEE